MDIRPRVLLYVSIGLSVAASAALVPVLYAQQRQNLPVLAVPILISSAPVLFRRTHFWRASLIFAALALWAFAIVSGFSIGLFFVPAALCIVVGALLAIASPNEAAGQ